MSAPGRPIAGAPEGIACAAGACGRRTVLVAGALGAGALAACGAAEKAAGEAVSSASDAVSGAVRDAVSKASVPEGGGVVLEGAKVVVTQPTAGEFKAFSAVCTHQGCLVSEVSRGTINCGCHGSRFDIATGEVRQGPATSPLPAKTVTVGGEGVSVS